MSYKNLLVQLDDRAACKGRVDAALALARVHSAHPTGLYVAADPALPGALRADIAPHLARHGIEVEAQHLVVRDMSIADAVLSRIADRDIDLPVMGA